MVEVTPELFCQGTEGALALDELLAVLQDLPGVRLEEKKRSLHVLAGKAAFLGVHPRKAGLRLNLVLARAIDDPRIVRAEQVSRARYHNELDVRPGGIDDQLREWIREAYELQVP
jgi:hypothetical protein